MLRRNRVWYIVLGLMVALFLSACADQEPQPTDISLEQANAVIAAAHEKANLPDRSFQ